MASEGEWREVAVGSHAGWEPPVSLTRAGILLDFTQLLLFCFVERVRVATSAGAGDVHTEIRPDVWSKRMDCTLKTPVL